MPPHVLILVALLVVLVIVVVYAVSKDSAWAHRAHWRARATVSDADTAAREVLAHVLATPNPTPLDHLRAATAITRDIIGQEHRPETAGGRPTRRAIDQARERRTLYDTARDQFIAAVDGARNTAPRPATTTPAPATTPANRTLLRERRMRQQRDQLHRDRLAILNAATEFAFGGMDMLVANDPLVQMLIAEDWAVNPDQINHPAQAFGLELFGGPGIGLGGAGALFFVDQPLAARTTALREEIVRERQTVAKETAAANGGARGAAVDAYVDMATQHTNDQQNVHDTGVLACLKAIVARLREDQGDLSRLPTADQIIADIRADPSLSRFNASSPVRPELIADVVAVIERTKAGERVVALGATDEECLRRVWHRADDPRNAANRGKLRQAVFDALLDAWEPDAFGGGGNIFAGLGGGTPGRHIACVNGRTGRILGALSQLDWDTRNWEVKRLEQFKNDIFARTRDTIADVAAKASLSDSADMRRAGQLYLAKNATDIAAIGDVPAAATEQLEDQMRTAISAMIDRYVDLMAKEYGVKDAIPPYMIEGIKAEAMAAV